MSKALYELGGLRFWSENEIELRRMIEDRLVSVVKNTLRETNPAWQFHRTEGPMLTPRVHISEAFSGDDVFVTNHAALGDTLCLRAETTASSYLYAKSLNTKLPLCVYQSGKSFRREQNDGASASKLRFNEFWQLEFQCIYPENTKNDYRTHLINALSPEVKRFTGLNTRIVESDRLPSYSESTYDIEVEYDYNKWREVASCSIRTDYSPVTKVCEIAFGLDRLTVFANNYNKETLNV